MNTLINVLDYNNKDVLDSWHSEGYVILDNALSFDDVDKLNDDSSSLIDKKWPDGEIIFSGMINENGELSDVKQSDFLNLSYSQKQHTLDNSNWRLHGFFKKSNAAHNIANNALVNEIVELLTGKESKPRASINFLKGSNQGLHTDSAVFHTKPVEHLIGAWVALENIDENSGPLVYYPKSHLEPTYHGFDNHPLTNLRTVNKEIARDYGESFIISLAEKYDRKKFLGNKGQVLLWHGGLIHGGSEIIDEKLSRKSFVLHYMPDNADLYNDIKVPTNWPYYDKY